jgi:hypothetical protein
MAGPFSGLTPDDIAKIESYYGGPPAQPSIDLGAQAFGAPVPPPAPPPVQAPPPAPLPAMPDAFRAKLDATLGPPPAQPASFDPSTLRPGEFSLTAPGAPPPAGPTAADDALFEQAKAKLAPPPPPAATKPGLARLPAPANPDPYGVKAARSGYLDTFGRREESMRRQAIMAEDQAAMMGESQRELVRRRDEDAAIANAEQTAADEDFNGRMQALQKSMDDVRAKKIDPTQATEDLGFMAVIGAIAGGLYQGWNGMAENPFLRDLDRVIERNIAAQEKDLDNQRQGIADEFNILGQQRALFKDSQAGKAATRLMYYEAAQQALEADKARYGAALNLEAVEEGIQTLEAEKQKHMLTFAEQQQALAARGAAAQYARQKEVQEAYRGIYDKVLTATGSPAIAEQEARRQVGVVYAPGSVSERTASAQRQDPIALVPKDQRTEAVKEFQAYANKDKVVGAIGQSFQAWRSTGALSPRQLDSTRSSIAGTIMANVPGVRSDVDFKEIVEPNLPARGDTEETLKLKEQTIRNFVESKTTTPILDAHAPGWRKPSDAELGLKDVR